MNEVKNFTINNKIYDNIGTLVINGDTYIVTQNGSDMVLVEAKKIDDKIIYSIPQKDENNTPKYKGIIFADEIISNLKREIELGMISSKEELQKRIEKSSNILNNDVALKGALQGQNIDEFKNNIKSLYEYFDSLVKETPDLDLSNYSSKIVDDKEYYFDSTDNDKFLVNRSDKSLTEELKDKENDARVQGNSITEEEAYNELVQEKEEIKTSNIKDINPNDVGSSNIDKDDILGLAMVKEAKQDDVNVKGNIEAGIYMDEEGKIITTKDVNDNMVAVEGGEKNAQTGEVTQEQQIASSVDNPNPLGIDEETITLDEVEALLTHSEELNETQITYLEQLRDKKKLEYEQGSLVEGMTNSKQKKLVSPWGNGVDNRAAYVNLIVLCLFVQVFMLLIIIGTIFFMK